MKNKIICFIGLDGSGKSTCIEYAYNQLNNEGVKTKIVRAAYVAVFTRYFIKLGKMILMRGNSNEFVNYKTYLENLRKQGRKGFVYNIFSMITTLEFKIQIFFSIYINKILGYTLLVDRYIYDNVVTCAANLGFDKDYMIKTLNTKWKHSPKPDAIIYINTPVDICCSRKNDIPDPYYLEIRKPLYDELAQTINAKNILGNQEKQKMLNEVIEEIHIILKK